MSKTNRIARRAKQARGAKINHEEGVLDRKHLFESNLDRIEQTRRDALACGMDEPVVICGDATDPTLRMLVDARCGGGAAEQLVRHHRSRRETPRDRRHRPAAGPRVCPRLCRRRFSTLRRKVRSSTRLAEVGQSEPQ